MVMGDRWRLDDVSGVWLVLRDSWDAAADLPGDTELLAPEVAAGYVDAWFPEGWRALPSDADLEEICLSLKGCFPGNGSPDPGWLRHTVREALRDGQLVAIRIVMHAPAGAERDAEEEAPAQRPPPREERTWIEIALVDDDHPPAPVPFKRYRIELTDGSVREGMLDEHGIARIAGIEAGTCKVTFPDFDDRDVRPG